MPWLQRLAVLAEQQGLPRPARRLPAGTSPSTGGAVHHVAGRYPVAASSVSASIRTHSMAVFVTF